jgi:hypothetical protein
MTMPQPPHLISALEQLDDDQPTALEVVEEEAPARRQPGSLVELFVEGEDPYTVRVTNRDRIAYEKTAARHKEWPAPENGRSFVMTFLVWNAARRAGRTAVTFDQWQAVLEDWEPCVTSRWTLPGR